MAGDTWKIIRLRWREHGLLMLGVAVLSTALATLAWSGGWLHDLERGAYDQALNRFTDGRGLSPNVSVVVIDQSSLDGIRANERYTLNFGSWPYSRNLWARVVEQLEAEGARAVVFDAVMDERSSDESTDLALAEVLRDTRVPFFLGVSTNANAQPLPRVDFAAQPASALAPPPAPPAAPVASAQDALPQEALPSSPGEETFPSDASGEFAEAPEDKAVASVTPEQVAHALAFPIQTRGVTPPMLEGPDFEGETSAPASEDPAHVRRRPVPPIPVLVGAVDGFGLVDTETDPDGFMRRTRFAYTDGINTYPTLPLRVMAGLYGASEVTLSRGKLRVGTRTYAVDADGGAAIDYGGGELHERFHTLPLLEVLDGWVRRENGQPSGLPSEALRGKVVVIGGTALGLGDIKATSFRAEVPGVMKQAAVLDTLLGSGRFITRTPLVVDVSLTLVVAFISVVLLMTTRWLPLEIAWPVALLLGMYLVTGRFLSSGTHVLTALPAMAGLVASVTAVAFNHLVANRETEFVRTAFSRFMEPKLVEQMISERKLPRLDGENVEISAFFSDIRGFSTFSERFKEDPRSLVRILNTYLTRVSGALLKEGGCLDKYIGDAVVCLFGAPMRQDDHAVRACRGALAAKAEVDKLREEFRVKGLPDVYTRIGVNSAVNFVGNFGSEQLFSYTAIGDGMNLAARLEGANKAYGSVIMIGPRTYELAREHIEVRELDRVRVAGKTEAVTVYELLALKGGLDAGKRATVERYHAALALYREARFDEAASRLEALKTDAPEDGPTQALLERCHKYAKAPPPDFDGVASLDK
ncbi:adenylate/guanylate cyclase domain-containing protein [Myxococcus stipitatus DSM 14675]|uniref:Adenylate/guanylate cyclase domain-containing protein n=1 Tax=Myxococcus stipitatus (strain DSM 14675 / JCM 12634 / Mx s8) TaxID=1278073 RepID=L7U6B8_MYXSD|nr:adenylate/guanylate cyclase domain-containing protein [Myxococcus stipitatus]AGC41994.1 adenylate/guanylate cyclase domain-containing protein [Myxococcus stipitatus DSM 14675]